MSVAGLLLAAGAGRRMGGPKALLRDDSGVSWVARAATMLCDAGCVPVVVVVGAAADQVAVELEPLRATVVRADDWEHGISASLCAGLAHLRSAADAEAVLVMLVDMPGVTAPVVRRVMAHDRGRGALTRATYDHRPGHPVLIGRDHWAALAGQVRGDVGARHYLEENDAGEVECGDLADGADVDDPADLR